MFNFIPRWKKLFIFLSAIVITVIPLAAGMVSAEAEDASDSNQSEEAVSTEALEKEIKKLEKKLDNLRDKKSTLQSELDYADNQIYLTQLRVQSVQNQINAAKESIEKLVLDIENLTNRLEKIKESIEYQENLLNQRKREYYKIDQTTPKGIEFLLFLIEPSELDKKIQKITYSQIMQERDKNLLDEMNKTKYAYANQKDIFEEKKG